MIYSVYDSDCYAAEIATNEQADMFSIYESANSYLTEGVVGDIFNGIIEFIKKIIDFIKELIHKIITLIFGEKESKGGGAGATLTHKEKALIANLVKKIDSSSNKTIGVSFYDTEKIFREVINIEKEFDLSNMTFKELRNKYADQINSLKAEGDLIDDIKAHIETIRKLQDTKDKFNDKYVVKENDIVMVFPDILKEEIQNKDEKYIKSYSGSLSSLKSIGTDYYKFYTIFGYNSYKTFLNQINPLVNKLNEYQKKATELEQETDKHIKKIEGKMNSPKNTKSDLYKSTQKIIANGIGTIIRANAKTVRDMAALLATVAKNCSNIEFLRRVQNSFDVNDVENSANAAKADTSNAGTTESTLFLD